MQGGISAAFERGEIIPYLGPGVLKRAQSALPEALVAHLTSAATVEHNIETPAAYPRR